MTGDHLIELQEALVWAFAPILQWWMTLMIVFGFVGAVFQIFSSLLRWMSR